MLWRRKQSFDLIVIVLVFLLAVLFSGRRWMLLPHFCPPFDSQAVWLLSRSLTLDLNS